MSHPGWNFWKRLDEVRMKFWGGILRILSQISFISWENNRIKQNVLSDHILLFSPLLHPSPSTCSVIRRWCKARPSRLPRANTRWRSNCGPHLLPKAPTPKCKFLSRRGCAKLSPAARGSQEAGFLPERNLYCLVEYTHTHLPPTQARIKGLEWKIAEGRRIRRWQMGLLFVGNTHHSASPLNRKHRHVDNLTLYHT